jgi:uncharacterized surface protein with fasciclin (FAS1) repeats
MKLNFTRAAFAPALLVLALWLVPDVGASAKSKAKQPKGHDITDMIYANPILTSFAKMLQASPDIYTFLSSKGPFTVFVPTDSAFAKLRPGEFESLLRPENTDRRNAILLFHVINGKSVGMKDLIALHAIFSCQGNPLSFRLTHTGVFLVQRAKVTHADIHCANGELNEIDSLLMPPAMALPALKAAPVVIDTTPAGGTNAPPTNAVTTVPVIGNGPGAIPALPEAQDVSPH